MLPLFVKLCEDYIQELSMVKFFAFFVSHPVRLIFVLGEMGARSLAIPQIVKIFDVLYNKPEYVDQTAPLVKEIAFMRKNIFLIFDIVASLTLTIF